MARRSAGRQRTVIAERGEIYLVSLDPTQGHEQQGRRPVLVVSPGAFNRLTMVPVVAGHDRRQFRPHPRFRRVACRRGHTDHRRRSL